MILLFHLPMDVYIITKFLVLKIRLLQSVCISANKFIRSKIIFQSIGK